MVRRRALAPVLILLATGAAACGSQGFELAANDSAQVKAGARLFYDKCSGCHTLDVVGTEGSNINVRDKERVDGPNFNVRKEEREQVLYAIRNGGFSGAIMPENIVTGGQADQIADFLAKYSGSKATEAGASGS